jgi:DNA-binding winged helix-turn-helix (wHTH) protein
MPEGSVRVLDLDIDFNRRTVRRGSDALELPDLSFRLLEVLVLHAPHQVDKDELIREVWGDVIVSDETLAQRVRLLRQVLDEDSQNPRYIASVRGRGYRLLCPVNAASQVMQRDQRWQRWLALAAATALLIVVGWYAGVQRQPGPATIQAIAVLPFADLSADQANRHFADGMQ